MTISTVQRSRFAARRILHHLTGLPGDGEALAQQIAQRMQTRGPGKRLQIAEETDLSPAEFHARYYRTGTPVVMRGVAKDWAAVREWSPAWLAERHGDLTLSVTDGDTTGGTHNVEEILLRRYMAMVEDADTSKYLRFGNLLHQLPELLQDFDLDTLFRYRSKIRLGASIGVFIGAIGTRTSLHAVPTENLFVQVHGIKRWTVYDASSDPALRPVTSRSMYYWSDFDAEAPDAKRFPAAPYLDWYDFELHPGDVLYNPASNWHQVTNLTASIGCGFRWMSPMAPRRNFTQWLLFFLATNPSVLYLVRNRREFHNVLIASQKGTVKELEKQVRRHG
ncbi:MAG: hypothetical protein ACJAZO_003250 [Myxococcota bacterium]|jgi:hypothetical protein